MVSPDLEGIARQGELIYEERLKTELERLHRDRFVAIEPISGEYFLGDTLSEAIQAARTAYPNRLSHVLRVGHRAAVHFGRLTA